MADWIPWVDRTYTIRRVPHHMTNRKRFPWPFCKRCGLVALKNPVSQKALKHGCEEYVYV